MSKSKKKTWVEMSDREISKARDSKAVTRGQRTHTTLRMSKTREPGSSEDRYNGK